MKICDIVSVTPDSFGKLWDVKGGGTSNVSSINCLSSKHVNDILEHIRTFYLEVSRISFSWFHSQPDLHISSTLNQSHIIQVLKALTRVTSFKFRKH